MFAKRLVRVSLKTVVAACLTSGVLGLATDAAAQEAKKQSDTSNESRALRIALEEVGLLLAGTGYYFMQHEVNSLDWTFDYSWDTVEAKLTGDAYSFDTNFFKTNTLAHSGAGTLYYLAARGNYLSPAESLAVGFFASAAWEFFAEFRERVSINDQMVTPFGGFAFGEAMTQVGRLFLRGCDSTSFGILGAVFAPSESLHRSIDGTQLPRARRCNSSGFSTRDDYVLRLGLGASFSGTWSARDGRGWLLAHGEALILDVPKNQTVQEPWRAFYDGGLSQLSVRVQAAADELREIDVIARGSLFGSAYRDVTTNTVALLALGAGVNYSERRYSAAPAPRDPFFVLEAPALFAYWRRGYGHQRLELGLVAGASFVQAGAFALPVYLQTNTADELTPVVANRGYSHGFGLTLSPHLRWTSPFHEVWLGARVDRAWAVRSRIGDQLASSPVDEEEARRRLRAALSLGEDERWRFRTEADFIVRRGTLGELERRRGEFTWTTGVEGRF
ncbi:MAG TPA: DUF3943 domain-containing protein [Polyangiaceae bacterium]|nr:DUF3943 domain-containing protein [Polyangiaceae bacterium]